MSLINIFPLLVTQKMEDMVITFRPSGKKLPKQL